MAVVSRLAPPQRTYSDEQLVAAARRSSDPAFAELYNRHAPQVRRFVAGRVGDIGRAEDLTQEVFVAALRRLRATETPIAFKPWLFEIARNACIDEFRRGQRRPEVVLEAGALEDAVGPAAPSVASPEAAMDTRQTLSDLRGAFHALSPEQHRLIVLRELEGCSYEEIAARLGVSQAIVESGLFRARRKLGQEYDELASGRRCEVVQSAIAAGDDPSLRGLGVRRRRQISRHLAHCQPCRRAARDAELGEGWFRAPTLAEKLAALLPLPWLPWRSRRAGSSPAGNQLASLAQPLGPLAHLSGPLHGLSRAAAAVVAVLIAGVGGSALTPHPAPRGNSARPPAVAHASGSPRAPLATPLALSRRPADARAASGARAPDAHAGSRSRTPRPGSRRQAAVAPGVNPAPATAPRPAGPLALPAIPTVRGVTAGGSSITGAAVATVGRLGQTTATATAGLLDRVSATGRSLAAATGTIAATAGGAAAATAGSVVKRTVHALPPVAH